METKYSSKASLFLMELIIAVLFFAISSAICTQLFVKSHILSQQTISENHTVLWVQNISEVFYSQGGDFQACKDFFQNDAASALDSSFADFFASYQDHFYLLFDSNWEAVNDSDSAKYMVMALYSADSSFHYVDLCAFQIPATLLSPSNDTDMFLPHGADLDSLSNALEEQQIWHYSLQVKSYQGLKGGNHE